MKKLTKKQKEKLAHEILNLLKEYGLNTDVHIYFAGKCIDGEGKVIENVKASDYFDYANDNTLSMSFEGAFYEIINYYTPEVAKTVMPKFTGILNSYGLYYELGEPWNLAAYYINSVFDPVKKTKEGECSKTPIYISRDTCPAGIEPVRTEWERRQNDYGDAGSCVIGAGFRFKYDGLHYKMPPQGCWQGSCSWETSKHIIQDMLNDAGCTDITYIWGNMD